MWYWNIEFNKLGDSNYNENSFGIFILNVVYIGDCLIMVYGNGD